MLTTLLDTEEHATLGWQNGELEIKLLECYLEQKQEKSTGTFSLPAGWGMSLIEPALEAAKPPPGV